jgi:apolipoprotein N-acyltransferase
MIQRLFPALLTPVLLWLAWPGIGFTPFLFVAFIPMLWLEHSLTGEEKSARNWFLLSWLAFGLFNLLCTWWLNNAHWSGVLMTTVINGGLMAIVMAIFRFIKSKLGAQRGYVSIPFLWICLEVLHKNWDLSFPWLNLGNGFANRVEWIQWYEHVGAFGGTFWVWAVNLLLFWCLRVYVQTKEFKPFAFRSFAVIVLAVILPASLSYLRYLNYEEKGTPANIVVVQPNIDTYTEKNILTNTEQATKFMRLANLKLNNSIDFLIGPEDLLAEGTYQDKLESADFLKVLRSATTQYPHLGMIVGGTTLRYYADGQQSQTARSFDNSEAYYDVFNSAWFIRQNQPVQLYHKSKRVAGVEMFPFSGILKPVLGDVVQDMGGTTGGLATQSTRDVFTSENSSFRIAPLICWESDFGEYVTGYVRNGANILTVITNDDWWGNTPGHVQHLHYSRLRAIENRRAIARSGNTGISCFINQRGDVLQPTSYKKDAVIEGTVLANNELTYYSRTGDFIGRVALFISGFMLLFAFVRGYLRKVNSQV